MAKWYMRLVLVLCSVGVAAGPAAALNFVKIATFPRGANQGAQPLPMGDTDQDGRLELFFEQSAAPFSLNIWEHWGQNSYQPVLVRNEGCHPLAVGDPDQDGLSDLLCQWAGEAFMLESRSPGGFPQKKVWSLPLAFPSLRGYIEDADRDGRQELWLVLDPPDVVEVWENRGNNTYDRAAVLADPTMDPATLAFGDFDGDGRTEIVVTNSNFFLHVWENTGDDTYALVWTYRLSGFALSVAAARNLDGRGKPQFVVGEATNQNTHRVTVFEATGDNQYAPVWQVDVPVLGPGFGPMVTVGDVDGDGVEEVVVQTLQTTSSKTEIRIFKAVGVNQFQEVWRHATQAQQPNPVAVVDLNGNGVPELVFNEDDEHLVIYELDTLQPPVLIPAWFPARYRTLPGRPLPAELELFNRTGAQQVVDAWVELYQGTGEGGPQGPLVRQQVLLSQVALSPGVPLSRRVVLGGPPGPGPYTFQVKVGTFPTQVIDTRWFTVNLR